MIQLYVRCKNLYGEVIYEGVKREYKSKEVAYYDFLGCLRKLKSQPGFYVGYGFKYAWSHIPKNYSEDMKRCDYAIKIGACRSYPYRVVYSLRGLNK